MKQFISLFLIFGISFFGFAQEITVTTPKEKPKTATKKVVKTKPTTKPKVKPKAQIASKTKAKTKARSKITTIEGATKDGKPITLRSNGTWEYTKTKPVAKETTKPVVKEVKKPVVKEVQKPVAKEIKKPAVKETQKPVAKEVKKPVVKETPKPVAKVTPTPKPVAKSTPTPASCDLALRDSPMIRGLKLGMSRNDADRIIPDERVRVLDSPTIIAYPKYGDTGFENVYSITAQFYDDALSELIIEYDPDAKKWKNAREFAQNLSANLNLPFKFWKFGKNAASSEMQCRDFRITLDSASNEVTLQSVNARQKTAQETGNRKEIFKP
jgi:hypothetical protein